jgi:hypothetical protein
MEGIRIDKLCVRKLLGLIRRKIDSNKVAPVRGGRSNADEQVMMIRRSTLRQMIHIRRSEIDTKAPEKRIRCAQTMNKEEVQKIKSIELHFCEPTDQIEWISMSGCQISKSR